MAITFVEERKKQRKLLLVFGVIIVLIVIVMVWGLRKKIPSVSIGNETVVPTFKKPEIDFTILESQGLKDLEPFEEIKPFEDKTGRGNPFVPY